MCQFSLTRRGALARMAAGLGASSFGGLAFGQEYPARPIEFVVPFAAGQSPDVVTRALIEPLSQKLGQPVVIMNKPGAGGAVGYRYAHAKPADGYTMVLTSNSLSTAYFGGQMPFDYSAFDHIGQITAEIPVIAVPAASPFQTLEEFIAEARRRPGDLSIATGGGMGGHMYLTAVALASNQKIDVKQVSFPTTNHVMSVLGGHTDSTITLPGSLASNVKAGQLRVLAALGSHREPIFSEVPTAREQSVDFASDLWRGVAMPKGVSPAVIDRVGQALREAVLSPAFKNTGDQFGFTPTFLAGSDLTRMIAAEHQQIEKVMAQAGLLAKS